MIASGGVWLYTISDTDGIFKFVTNFVIQIVIQIIHKPACMYAMGDYTWDFNPPLQHQDFIVSEILINIRYQKRELGVNLPLEHH